MACLATRRDNWTFRKNIAEVVGCCVRTVGRGFRDARERGLMNAWRGKKGEIPPGAKAPLKCGWSHRTVYGWGQRPAERRREIEEARARWLVHEAQKALPKPPKVRVDGSTMDPPGRRRAPRTRGPRMTSEQIDAALAELERQKREAEPERPPKPPPRDD